MSKKPMQLTECGPGVLLVVFGTEIAEETNRAVRAFCTQLEYARTHGELCGVIEWTPAYCTVSVRYDPFTVSRTGISAELMALAAESTAGAAADAPVKEVPVCYEEAYAPDMQNVCRHSGLTAEQVIAAHCAPSYLVYMLGFLPGFVYLGGLDERLNTPRLASPRTKIPAGSVAIGGAQTGIYPLDSPGGWQIIGKTPLTLYDPSRNPPVLFKAGDRIRFVPVSADEFRALEEKAAPGAESAVSGPSEQRSYTVTSGVQVISGGPLTTVQDAGRAGYQKDGFCVSGVMDRVSYVLANITAGNEPGAAVLETTLCGPELRFTLETDFAVTGADQQPLLDDTPVPLYTRVHAEKGSVLRLGMAVSGMRSYIAFTGGVLVPQVLGSRSTSLKYALGGYAGRKLLPGDELAVGEVDAHWKKSTRPQTGTVSDTRQAGCSLPSELLKPLATVRPAGALITVRVVRGPQYDLFTSAGKAAFTAGTYTVTPESDRMGYRFAGSKVDSIHGTDIISDPVVSGSVQIPASGMPIVMMADHQTAGGYAKIASVIEADLPLLAQAQVGTPVQFVFVTEDEAFAALRSQELQLRMIQEYVIDEGGDLC